MRVSNQILCLLAISLAVGLHVQAQENKESPAPPKYRLELVRIIDGESTEYCFVVGKIGFHSLASFKEFLSTLPPGSILEWDPGCLRHGDEPLLSSREELEDFRAFCADKKIKFNLLPSG
jgi:hypothetical protein